MTRTDCPQVKGIYGYNSAELDDVNRYLLIGNDNPREVFSTDAFKVVEHTD